MQKRWAGRICGSFQSRPLSSKTSRRLHRIRTELIKQRTAKANQIRGLVAEYGLVAPTELWHLRRALPCWLEDAENGLSGRFRRLLNGLWGDLQTLDERLNELDREITTIARSDPVARRLQQLRGVGPIVATALVAAVGNGEQFAKGRQMSAALWLTPRQQSSGGKERLLGISKRGDVYLRAVIDSRCSSGHPKRQRQRRPPQSVGDTAGCA
jgi:transposase